VGEFHPQVKNYLPTFLPTKGGANARHLLKHLQKIPRSKNYSQKRNKPENDHNIKKVVGKLVKRNIFLKKLFILDGAEIGTTQKS